MYIYMKVYSYIYIHTYTPRVSVAIGSTVPRLLPFHLLNVMLVRVSRGHTRGLKLLVYVALTYGCMRP